MICEKICKVLYKTGKKFLLKYWFCNELQAALGRGEECKGLPQGQHQVRLSSILAG
jgi:hypothetical protein